MSDQDTIFGNEEVKAAPVDPAVEPSAGEVKASDTPLPDNSYADLLASIKTEDGRQKYASVEAAIEALGHSQQFIEKLMQEKKELEVVAAKAKATDELLSEIKKAKSTPEADQPQGIDEATIQKLIDAQVDSRLSAREQQAVEDSNADKVRSAMSKAYGEKAKDKYIEAAEKSGISVDMLNQLAKTSPDAAIKLIGIQSTVSEPNLNSSINTEALAPKQEEGSLKFKDNFSQSDLTQLWQNARKRVTQE